MNKQFFQKILPTQGNICIAGIEKKVQGVKAKITPKFTTDIDRAMEIAQTFVDNGLNAYFTPGTYEGESRKAVDSVWFKCFFLDIDVEHGEKRYETKADALTNIERFRTEIQWPTPTIVDSGGGIHAYWIFNEEIPADEWTGYAEKFKQLCLDHNVIIDEDVPADAARLMRIPGTPNLRYDPPQVSMLLNEVVTYDIDLLLPALGSVETPFDLKSIDKGLDPDTQAILEKRRGNFEYDFGKIVVASLQGDGCEQIKYIIENAAACPEPLWYAGLSVATRCRDGAQAIHLMSEGHPEYNPADTERKAAQSLREANWAHGCEAFRSENSTRCIDCKHWGRITGPIDLGKVLKIAQHVEPAETPAPNAESEGFEDEAQPVRATQDSEKILVFPDFLSPYQRGVNGGIYYMPPPRRDKKGKLIQDDPEMITPNDVYPIKRVYSPQDGECLVMRLYLPLDNSREFLLPLKDVAALDKLKTTLASNGVVFELGHAPKLSSYLMKWAQYLMDTRKADVMRMQQGWTEDMSGFVIGTKEITAREVRHCPPSPMAKNVVKNLGPQGSYDVWKECIGMFNDPGYELHAFTVLCGFASPLMELTNVNGVTLSLYSEGPGTGKTGALYGALSVWGKPDALSVFDATGNALISRMITSKNLPFGMDEQGNLEPKTVSNLIYNVSSGMPKLRMMSSANQERDVAFNTKLVAIMTTNKAIRSLLYEHRANATAESVRLLEPEVEKPDAPGYVLTAERGILMFDRLKSNCGHAGPEYIEELFRLGLDSVRRMVNTEFMKVAERYTNNSEYRFLSNLMATARAAGMICNARGILSFDLDRIFDVVGKTFDDVIAGKKKEDESSRADVVGDFINKNIQSCLVLREGKVTTEPRNSLFIRAEVDNGLIYISTSAMKEYLKNIRMDTKHFENRLKSNGILQAKIKKQMAAGWKDAFGSTNVNAYELRMDVSHIFKNEEAA
jgi:hypothetical protein